MNSGENFFLENNLLFAGKMKKSERKIVAKAFFFYFFLGGNLNFKIKSRKSAHKNRSRLFFSYHIIFGAEIKHLAQMRGKLQKIPIICCDQNNRIFWKQLNLGTRTKDLSPILGKDFFSFFRDQLILGTKLNEMV